MTSETADANQTVVAWERRHLVHGLGVVTARPPAIEHGTGSRLVDVAGREFLDLFAGAGRCVLGHGDQGFAAALADQAGRLAVTRHPSSRRAAFGEALAGVAPDGLTHLSMFSTGGEAVDAAVRIAREATGRRGVVVFDGSFHGRSSGVAGLTDGRWLGGGPGDPEVHRCPFPSLLDDAPTNRLAEALDAVAGVFRQPGANVAAVLVEPAQGTNGNQPPAPGFLSGLAALAKTHGALVIADEVLTGFGRTGRLFASEAADHDVDLMVIGKGMANGFPVAGVLARPELVEQASRRYPSFLSSTYGGNPLAVAASSYVLDTLLRRGLPERARRFGAVWAERLRSKLADGPLDVTVHGVGLMLGIEIRVDLSAPQWAALDERLADHGLLVGRSCRTLRVNPALTIDESEAEEAADRLAAALAVDGSELKDC
ncbi:aspartate aminotransferase family protein [Streptomyces sp. ME02-6979.5a]|uniref:aspartate aminotransferase family protein n=1 Tax=Streptomyces sp. ME02-6979.5a TaxID=462925 RepID=UPI0029AB87A8|nr:aspartate aminotransferase family protein [Streptomyces sp. ME02-6979.5a]MDX3339693.1 aspartate aminotransferase family protein [Streptomyces sp. ME02-6979.5a]